MAVPTTYETLIAEIAALTIRDDLTDLIPNFIGYAEKWMQREVFSPERKVSTTLTVTDGSADLPADFGGVKLVYADGDQDTVLRHVTPERLRQLYPGTTTGTPLYFAIQGETMLFGPWPSSGAAIALDYVQGITALTIFNTTNWVLTAYPDLYVNAALAEAFEYTRDYEEANRRRTLASGIGESVNRHGRRREANSGPLAASNPVTQVSRYARC